jgi:hypothetical protein
VFPKTCGTYKDKHDFLCCRMEETYRAVAALAFVALFCDIFLLASLISLKVRAGKSVILARVSCILAVAALLFHGAATNTLFRSDAYSPNQWKSQGWFFISNDTTKRLIGPGAALASVAWFLELALALMAGCFQWCCGTVRCSVLQHACRCRDSLS